MPLKEFITYRFSEKGAYHTTWESTEVNQEAEGRRGMKEIPLPEPLLCFHGKEGVKQRKQLKIS